VNFLDTECQTGPFVDLEFGLCDDQSSPTAYVDIAEKNKWLATVSNPKERDVIFTAIDKCVIKDGDARGRPRCDCMLTVGPELYLIELKERDKAGWQSVAAEQLESTIKLISESHGVEFLKEYNPKKAYICNRNKHPFFKPDFTMKKRFYNEYQFRLYVQTLVKIP
jgi:hypothetical protein